MTLDDVIPDELIEQCIGWQGPFARAVGWQRGEGVRLGHLLQKFIDFAEGSESRQEDYDRLKSDYERLRSLVT